MEFTTQSLIELFVKDQLIIWYDLAVNDYELNGSIIKIRFSYNPKYDSDKTYISYDNKIEFYLLDYITWLYNNKKLIL